MRGKDNECEPVIGPLVDETFEEIVRQRREQEKDRSYEDDQNAPGRDQPEQDPFPRKPYGSDGEDPVE